MIWHVIGKLIEDGLEVYPMPGEEGFPVGDDGILI